MGVKITDLVDQQAIDKIAELNGEIQSALETYLKAARDMAKGLQIDVKVVGDLDKLEKLYIDKATEAAEAETRLTAAVAERNKVVANTTNTISRQLMEQERRNKLVREEYRDGEKVKEMLSNVIESYENNSKIMAKLDLRIKANKESQKALEKQYKSNIISEDQYIERQAKLLAVGRDLALQKSNLSQVMKIEEKMNNETESSYNHLSHQLELLKKTYKELSHEQTKTESGMAMERAIQELDAHLKDLAADMGEFQRNVGNYAIAGQNGVVATESINAVLARQAVTMQDVSDQTKILEDAKRMLDTSDEHYAETLATINGQIDENKRKLADVSDIMNVQATSASEAEAQNKRLQEALKLVDQESDGASATIAELNDKIDENNKVIDAASGKQASIKTDLKELVLQIANLSIEYQNLSDEEKASAEGQELAEKIRTLTEEAGALKDAIADTNAAIANAASDTRGFDQLGGAMQLAIDGFGLATGAAEMLGISTGDLAEIQTKLQAAIAASNAMQSIQNTLQSQSAVMQGVAIVQTKLRATAENLHTAAKGKGVIATGALTAAQWAFNAAASANPIGLLVVGITLAIGAVYGLVKAFQAFFGPSKESVKNYERQKEVTEELCEVNNKLEKRMKARGATETEMYNLTISHRKMELEAAELLFESASKLYKKDSDEYKEALEAKRKADEEYQNSLEDSLNYLMKIKVQADAKEREMSIGTLAYKIEIIEKEKEEQLKLAANLLEMGKITKQMYEDIVASVNKSAEFKIKEVREKEEKSTSKTTVSGNSADDAKKRAEELKKAVQAGEDALLKIISDSLERQREAELLSFQRQLKELNEQLAKTKDSQVQLRQSLYRQIEGLQAEHNEKMLQIQYSMQERTIKAESDIITSRLDIVKKGSAEELELKQKQLDNRMSAELLAVSKSENAKTLTTEQAEEMRANIFEKYARLQEKAIEDYTNKRAGKIQEEYATESIIRDQGYTDAVNALKTRYAEEMKAANGNAAMQEEIRRKLDNDMFELDVAYSKNVANANIKMIEDILNLEDLSAEDRLKWERELAQAKMSYSAMVADANAESVERQISDDDKLRQKRKENLDRWLGVASDVIGNISGLVNAMFDSKIERLEADQEANTKAGEKEQERITELVNKKVITEEEGEARKRAAEAQTAKKNEELERKKAALQRKQAIFQKATDLAQAGISTALAITNALTTSPFPLGLAMAAIAGTMGAIQMATILATPIPQYAKGTDRHKGGPAIVGDGGRREVVFFNSEAWLTPDRPTLVDLPVGTKVFPSVNAFDGDIVNVMNMDRTAIERPNVVVNNDYTQLQREVRTLGDLIRTQTRVQRQIAYNHQYELFKKSIL